jgi:GT2 family glycosyltransferase
MSTEIPPDDPRRELQDLRRRVRTYQRLAARAVELANRLERVAFERRRLDRRIERLTATNERLRRSIADLRSRPEWKVGRAITLLPRALRNPRLAAERLRSGRTRPDSTPSAELPSVARSEGAAVEPTVTRSDISAADDVSVSIVIPVYNGIAVTKRCIESIYASRTSVPFEVVVVDNASSDGVSEWLEDETQRRPRFTLVRNPENRGFAGAINQGVTFAAGDEILICNNDVVLTDDALDRLHDTLAKDDQLGVVSPVTNYVGEGPQIDSAASGVGPSSASWYGATLAPVKDVDIVPDRLVFFCVLVRRALFDLLGGLSDAYGIGNFEDDDFSVRARLAGYTLAVHRGAFAFHHGSYTFKTHGDSQVDWITTNRRVFYDTLAELSTTRGSMRVRPSDAAVSVVVRTIDRPRALKEALQSLANQTVRPQVVVVNDGGPPVDEVVASFKDELEIVSLRHDEPKGRGGALNAGVAAADRRWVSFLDDDDILYPFHLELLLNGVEQSGFPVAYGLVDKVLYRVEPERYVVLARQGFGAFEFDPQLLLAANRITIHSFVAPRQLILDVGGFDEELPVLEDWDFLIRLSRRVPFTFVRRTTCEYRFLVGGSLMNSVLSARAKSLQAAEQIYARYPVEDEEVLRRRRAVVDGLRDQVALLKELEGLDAPPEEKALMALKQLKIFTSVGSE